MNTILTPLQLIITATAGWLSREQAKVIDLMSEQARVLLEANGGKCPRLTDDQTNWLTPHPHHRASKPPCLLTTLHWLYRTKTEQ